MSNKSPINYSWSMEKTELENVISNGETFLDQCLYSCTRQIKELEKIHQITGELIRELVTVQNWLKGER